ncbi:2Fe-2S iron-sulfur cluster-binding protein [Effusibacillus pohliae]|uniref:2Fe-2S iron-sulfur cluster-binding protein n=1 Tax=Effusibacillus pohliae TaxID=232270 RepID=UPI0003826203|nr:2Fe-2S iron-sulfur cluster-binding protein [Effusibacillus pohliae]
MPRIHFASTNKSVEIEADRETNILRASIRYEGGIPYRCGGGLCGTCKIHIEQGAENLTPIKKQEIARLGDKLQEGYRLACQTFTKGDVTITWDTSVNVKVPPKIKELWEKAK